MSIDRMALARHARRSASISLTILAIDISIYVLMIAGTVMAEAIWLQALFALGAGTMIALMAIVGHDAGHQSFSTSKLLNRISGTILSRSGEQVLVDVDGVRFEATARGKVFRTKSSLSSL